MYSLLLFQGSEFTVRVSFLEIYNEELIDLLGAESVENPRLKIYEDTTKKVWLAFKFFFANNDCYCISISTLYVYRTNK